MYTCEDSVCTNLDIRVHGWRRRSRRLLLLLEVVAAAPVDVGAEEPAAVLIVVRVRRERRSHPETTVEVLSVLQIIIAAFNIEVLVICTWPKINVCRTW